ncbi:NAD-dependent epimerase/dehydratase family protein [Malaciobacter marinus]|uniref:NAD-dependent epimerase/dehydratase family protein n=1 Tax=Malaciobacter marinus TaxID=505249 RepID=UPI0009A90598|nr:NAD-dependent epimerase/dehydratase family protein [Malaciobacter marinus]SKB26418.1 UDP-glucose 4-epimerase [Malaciobacter marinus]
MKKLLITGSNGFVGKYFINKYKNKYDIKTFSFLKDDINSLDCSDVDVVFHLSALVHQMAGASASEYERVNVTQTLELAKKAKKSGVKHFVFMSTVKVYGEETINVYTESSECKAEDEYGKSKLKAEEKLLKLEDESFKVSIIRTPIVYGYGVKANIKSLVNLVDKISILPFGKIENKRSMVYIGNLCHLVDVVIGATEVALPSVFLASDDEPLSTSRLCELIAKSLNKKVYLIKVPFFESLLKLVKPSFHKRLYRSLEVDNSITKERLDLSNPYSVEEGIGFMIKGENSLE